MLKLSRISARSGWGPEITEWRYDSVEPTKILVIISLWESPWVTGGSELIADK
jgi:hypothetical protein